MGRPYKQEVPLSHDIKVRVDDVTFTSLNEYCKANSIPRAEVIRTSIQRYIEGVRSGDKI